MRWLTLVLSVTLFYSLSIVYAIPHDVDEKHHWLHKRQGLTSSSPPVSSPVVSPTQSPQGESTSPVSPTPSLDTQEPSSRPTSSSSTPTQPTPTPEPSPEPSSTSSSSSSSIPSTSSSSSQSTSSTRSRTTSPSPTTINRSDTQSRTSSRRPSSTVPATTVSANGNSRTGTGSGSSFLKNKAAMGSTFAIVGLVGVAIIIGIVFFLIKKARKRRDQDELDTYFEKLPGNNGNSGNNRNVGGNDDGLSPTTSPAHDQAYMSRDVHYGVDQYPNPFANYNGFEYPPERASVIERPASVAYAPGTAYAAAMSQRGQYNYQGQVEDPNAVPNHPFADPDNRHY